MIENFEIRWYMRSNQVPGWKVARALEIGNNTFYCMLRRPLKEYEIEMFKQTVDSILSNTPTKTRKEWAKEHKDELRLKSRSYGNRHLSVEDVSTIRKVYKKGDKKFGINALAKKYNCSPSSILNIIHYKTWKEDVST